MVEHNGLDIMCLSKYCHSSSSSSSSEHDKKIFSKLKCNLSRDYPKKNAEIMSGQYGANVLLIGAALMLAIANHGPTVKEEHLLSFVTCLIIIQLFWMMWYILVRHRRKDARTERDVHATTCWIRGAWWHFEQPKKKTRIAVMHPLRLKTGPCCFKTTFLRVNKRILFDSSILQGG